MSLSPSDPPLLIQDGANSGDAEIEPLAPSDPNDPNKPAPFDYITENIYISPSLQTSKVRKRAKRMVCECQFDAETDDPEEACGETCLNRLLMIECGSRCPCGEYCTNKKFQRAEYANVEVFKTEKKGWGLRALEPIASGTFVMEYCGEVCTHTDFEARKLEYMKDKRRHYYFMSLTTDEILDATRKGNLSRYINHSCDPNSETQKWTVNGKLRIGFFSVRDVEVSEELTFDYKFERFGDVAQKCYCGSANCRGYLGQTKQTPATLKVVTLDRELGSPRSPSSSRRRPRQRIQSDADSAFEKELYDIVGSSWRLKSNDQTLAFCRLMLQAESPTQRIMLLQVLQATDDTYLKKFIGFHGLRLLWSWMVDSSDLDSSEGLQFRMQVLQTLNHLPITSKNQLDDNKILQVVKRWAEHSHIHRNKPSSEEESVVSSHQQPSSTDEQLEATVVVTEADSRCEPATTDPESKQEVGVASEEVGGATEEPIRVEENLKEEKEGATDATSMMEKNSKEEVASEAPVVMEDELREEKQIETGTLETSVTVEEDSRSQEEKEGESKASEVPVAMEQKPGEERETIDEARDASVSIEESPKGQDQKECVTEASEAPAMMEEGLSEEGEGEVPAVVEGGPRKENGGDTKKPELDGPKEEKEGVGEALETPAMIEGGPREEKEGVAVMTEMEGSPTEEKMEIGKEEPSTEASVMMEESPEEAVEGMGEATDASVMKDESPNGQDEEEGECEASEASFAIEEDVTEKEDMTGNGETSSVVTEQNSPRDKEVSGTTTEAPNMMEDDLRKEEEKGEVGAGGEEASEAPTVMEEEPKEEKEGENRATETPTTIKEDEGPMEEEKEGVSEPTEISTAIQEEPREEKEDVGGASEAPATTVEGPKEEVKDGDDGILEIPPMEGSAEMEGKESCEAEAREADSATMSTPPAESAVSEGVVGVVTKGDDDIIKEEGEEPGSCEAEAREQSGSEHSQDEGQSCEASQKLIAAAEGLLKKWESLKEIFRIPKRTPQRKKPSPDPQSSSSLGEDDSKETDEMDEEDVLLPSSSRRSSSRHPSSKDRHQTSRHSSPHERRTERQTDRQLDRNRARHRKGLLPTPKRSPLTSSSPSQRISAAAAATAAALPVAPPITTPPINPALSYPLPSTVAGYTGSHAHTYTTNFTGTAPVQNTVIVQQPGQSVYVQQQVFQDGLKTTILPTQYAPPTQRPPLQQPATQQYVQLNPTHLPSLPPLPTAQAPPATAYTQLTQQAGSGAGIIQNPIPVPAALAPPTGFVAGPAPAAMATNNVATLQPQYYQQTQQPQQLFVQSSLSSSLITGTSLLPQQQQQQQALSTVDPNPLALAPLPPPPPDEEIDLPLNWKTARDSNGKIYYYHSITRKTQWERPTDKDAEGTITMDLGTPEPESESEGDMSKIAPRGPRTPPPDYSDGEERMPRTPEGSPPSLRTMAAKRHKGPRTPPSPSRSGSSRHKSRRSKSKHKRRSGSRSSKVKGPRTPSPPPASGRSPVRSHDVLLKHSRSPSLPVKDEGHTLSNVITSPTYADLSPTSISPKLQIDENENSSIVEEKSLTTVECSESQVEKSGSNDNSPIPKPDSLKSYSPIPIPVSQHSPSTGIHSSPLYSSSQEHSPLNLSLTSDPGGGAEPQESAPPPRKKHRGEKKAKSKASKTKEEYRHKLSKVVTHCLDQHRKSDCKYGRITCADDFKYLARKLTYGLAEKEFQRKGGAKLDLTDSVKAKVKDYIRQYMKKFGIVYHRTSSP